MDRKSCSMCEWLPRVVLILVFALLSVGCSKGTVSGKVFYRGKPLSGGTVTFAPENGDARTAPIHEDGSYRIEKIAVGSAKIGVFYYGGPPASLPQTRVSGVMARGGAIPQGAPPEVKDILPSAKKADEVVTIPKHYEDPDKSGLTHSVKSGLQEFDIQLK